MAEAAGLSLASSIAAELQLNPVLFLTDNQTLADIIQKNNLDRPLDWRNKPFTQAFCNNKHRLSASVHKIDRRLNFKAHSLARRVFLASNTANE